MEGTHFGDGAQATSLTCTRVTSEVSASQAPGSPQPCTLCPVLITDTWQLRAVLVKSPENTIDAPYRCSAGTQVPRSLSRAHAERSAKANEEASGLAYLGASALPLFGTTPWVRHAGPLTSRDQRTISQPQRR